MRAPKTPAGTEGSEPLAVDVPDTLALSLDDVALVATRGATLHVAPFRVDALVASASLGGVIHGKVSCARAARYGGTASRPACVHIETKN